MPTKLGQNFLTDESISEKIVESAGLEGTDNVLEIGSGNGILTKYLIQKSKKLIAVEIDKNLAALLRDRIKSDKAKILEGDILKINLPKLIEENSLRKYKVVANLPYYITSKIIRLLLETKYPPREMILMVQKEIGERICATKGQESILSISVKFYAVPEILFHVSREKFSPVPMVDSAVIRIKLKENPVAADPRRFFSVVRAGFSSKRKQLLNNFSASFKLSKETVLERLKRAGIEPTKRAQELELEDWVVLAKLF